VKVFKQAKSVAGISLDFDDEAKSHHHNQKTGAIRHGGRLGQDSVGKTISKYFTPSQD